MPPAAPGGGPLRDANLPRARGPCRMGGLTLAQIPDPHPVAMVAGIIPVPHATLHALAPITRPAAVRSRRAACGAWKMSSFLYFTKTLRPRTLVSVTAM